MAKKQPKEGYTVCTSGFNSSQIVYMNTNIIIGVVVGVVIGAGAGYYLGYDHGWKGAVSDVAKKEAAKTTVNPYANVETNPLKNVKTNPYSDVKLNPFK